MAITSSGATSGGTVISSGGSYTILSGATLIVEGAAFAATGAYISGFGSGGTNYPAIAVASNGGVVSAATVNYGGVAMAAGGGTVAGGTAFNSGSIAAANNGYVSGATIGSNGGLLASMLSGYGGAGGTVVNAHVQTGGYALAGGGFTIKGQVFSGSGIISGTTFDVGSTEILVSGGTDLRSIFAGTQMVSSGGQSISSIMSGGTQIIFSAGVATSAVASAGGRIEVYSGGSSVSARIGSGGTLRVSGGGIAVGPQILSAGTATADSSALVSNAVISGGGTLTLNSGATLVGGTIAGTTSSGGAGGLLVVESGAVLSGITQMGWKSRLDIDYVQYTSGSYITASGSTITIRDASGNVLWTGSVTAGVAADYHLERDSADGSLILVYDKCFLKGTMIRTHRGEVAVENLVVGDRVIALENGEEVQREIIWTGQRSATVRQGLPDDEAGYPVRIMRNALGDNVPHKDLLVTPEHAMYLNGAFVPARMLVNGRSIIYDRSFTQFDFYHVETDEHSVIWSDGALSESYLDTGDRDSFSRNGPVVRLLNAPQRSWAEDAAAPLRVERDFVEPLFVELAERAESLEIGNAATPVKTTEDPDLHLVDATGRTIRAVRKVNRSHIFMVPADAHEVRIVSRVARPVDVVGAFLDDRRRLGVLVGEIQLWEAGKTRQIDAHFTNETLSGWANLEKGKHRWTQGSAVLPLAEMSPDGVAMLSIEILAGGPYAASEDDSDAQAVAG